MSDVSLNSGFENNTEVSVFAQLPGGRMLPLYVGTNRIMDASKANVLSSLYSSSYSQSKLATFKVGTGGTTTPGGADVKPVLGDRTELFSPIAPSGVYSNTLTSPAVTTDGLEISYQFSLPDSVLVGQNINEVALYKENGQIFNMKAFPSVFKSAGFSLVFIWKIRYK